MRFMVTEKVAVGAEEPLADQMMIADFFRESCHPAFLRFGVLVY